VARRGAWSTGGARGGIGEAIPWPEVPVGVEALSAAMAARRRAEAASGARGGETEVLLCDRGSAGKGTQRRGARVGRDTRLWADVGYWQAGRATILFLKFYNQHKLCNSIW
jgi:hypothetical protein